MNKTWFISDLHLGHTRMLSYGKRPFENLQQLDETIIKNWNNKVKKEHDVYILGDVSFYHKDKTKEIIEQLKGKKILILGNHDRRKSVTYWKSVGFNEVSKYPILFEEKYLLSHEPRYELDSNNLNPSSFYNVCVEKTNYKPIDFEKIKEKLDKQNTNLYYNIHGHLHLGGI